MNRSPRPSYQFGPFRLDLSEHVLLRDGQSLVLTPKVFEVLRVLVENAGHLVEKERLLSEVWPDSFVEEGALNRNVSILRRVLGERASDRCYIQTVPKMGYRFVAPVTEWFDDAAPPAVVARDAAAPLESPASRLWRILPVAVVLSIACAFAYAFLGSRAPVEDAVQPASTIAPEHRQVTFTGRESAPSISADGRRIAYVSDEHLEQTVMVQELAGGQPHSVLEAPEVGHLRWSPDGSELLVWARGSDKNGLYLVPQLGGDLVQIKGGQYIGCWSPDGTTIAVASYLAGKIWFIDRQGQEQRAVTLRDIPWSIWDIDWSPRSGLLTLVSEDLQGRFTIWTVRPDGREQTRVLSVGGTILSARWTPAGDAVYYTQRLNQTVSLFRMSVAPVAGNGRPPATTLLTGVESARGFGVSADGRRLVYAREPFHSNLWMIDVSRNGRQPGPVTQLTNRTSLIERPRLSPDGTAILFSVGHEPLANLFTMPVTGGPAKQLTFLDAYSVAGVWSADGRQIAFASTRGDDARIWTVDAAGGTPRAISSGELSSTFDVAWSPGPRILYQRAGNRDYYALDPATGQERLFVRDSSVGWLFWPVYSRDGRKVAVQWNRRPDRGLWTIDTREKREHLVYKTSAAVIPLGWSADGRSIYAVEGKLAKIRGRRDTLKDAGIVMVSAYGGPLKRIASLPFEEIGDVSMTSDGQRFVVTVYSSRSDVWIVDNFDRSPDVRGTRR